MSFVSVMRYFHDTVYIHTVYIHLAMKMADTLSEYPAYFVH